MSNSSLVNYTKISPYSSNPRTNSIKKITIHHMAGNLSVETCGNVFQSRQASSNYGIGSDGRVGMYVEEKNRSWASSSPTNDHQAVTIEVANNGGSPNWPVSDKALSKLIELCVDICKRNDIKELNYTGDESGNLTKHDMFAATICPGPYLGSKFAYIAEEVNKKLKGQTPIPTPPAETLYRVQVGAFSEFDNAKGMEDRLKSQGYDTYMVKRDGLYKVQTGAFSEKQNAEKLANELKAKGYDVYVTTKSGDAVQGDEIERGDYVTIKSGAKSYDSISLAGFVYGKKYRVDELSGERAVLDKSGICTPMHVKDLIKV